MAVVTSLLRPVLPRGLVASVLRRTAEAGVDVDIVLVEHDPVLLPAASLHRQAALTGISAAARRRGATAGPGRTSPHGRPVDVGTFYGPLYDWRARRLLVENAGLHWLLWKRRADAVTAEAAPGEPVVVGGIAPPGTYGPYSWAGENDPARAVFLPAWLPPAGLAAAFRAPPDRPAVAGLALQRLFLDVVDFVLLEPGCAGEASGKPEIWQWEPGDWAASYFPMRQPAGRRAGPARQTGTAWTVRTGPHTIALVGTRTSPRGGG